MWIFDLIQTSKYDGIQLPVTVCFFPTCWALQPSSLIFQLLFFSRRQPYWPPQPPATLSVAPEKTECAECCTWKVWRSRWWRGRATRRRCPLRASGSSQMSQCCIESRHWRSQFPDSQFAQCPECRLALGRWSRYCFLNQRDCKDGDRRGDLYNCVSWSCSKRKRKRAVYLLDC